MDRFERLNGAQIRARFPQWTVPDDMLALYQPDGGLVDAAMGNAVHIQLARSHGATIVENCKVTRIEPETAGTALVCIYTYMVYEFYMYEKLHMNLTMDTCKLAVYLCLCVCVCVSVCVCWQSR